MHLALHLAVKRLMSKGSHEQERNDKGQGIDTISVAGYEDWPLVMKALLLADPPIFLTKHPLAVLSIRRCFAPPIAIFTSCLFMWPQRRWLHIFLCCKVFMQPIPVHHMQDVWEWTPLHVVALPNYRRISPDPQALEILLTEPGSSTKLRWWREFSMWSSDGPQREPQLMMYGGKELVYAALRFTKSGVAMLFDMLCFATTLWSSHLMRRHSSPAIFP